MAKTFSDKKKRPAKGSPSSYSEKGPKKPKTSDSHSNHTHRPRRHADIVEQGKKIWNKLRLKSNTPADIRECMDELLPLIKGKANQIALQHDASRIVQAAIQYAKPDERKWILKELCCPTTEQRGGGGAGGVSSKKKKGDNESNNNNLVELCKSQYAHFVVLKALQYCHSDKECTDMIIKSLRGRVAKLATHAVASRVMESLFTKLPPKKLVVLKQEFYGPHFSLFATTEPQPQPQQPGSVVAVLPTLASNLKAAPDKTDATVEFVRNLVHKGMEKNLYSYTYFQDLFAEFLDYATPQEQRTLAASVADHAIHLLSSRCGTRVVANMVAYGTAKDRKRILKSCKGYGKSGLMHKDAYLAILRLVQLTDDTVSIQKNIIHELITTSDEKDDKDKVKDDKDNTATKTASPLLDIALSETASKLFLLLLCDDEARHKYFDPYEHVVLFPNPTICENNDRVDVPTSKKDANTRRKEVLHHLREPLLDLCERHAQELLVSRPGAVVLREVYAAYCPKRVVTAVVNVCMASLTTTTTTTTTAKDGKEDKEVLPLFEDRDGHLAVKNLVLVDATRSGGGEDSEEGLFASELYARLQTKEKGGGGLLMKVVNSNRGAFVVAAMCKVPSIQDQVRAELCQNASALEKLSKGKGATAGYAALLKEMSNK